MLRTARLVERVEATNRQIAEAACIGAELLAESLTPTRLHGQQVALRQSLLATERRLRSLAARKARRGRRIRERVLRKPDLRRAWGEHQRLLDVLDTALRDRRAILKQAGDSTAWLVLRNDPRLIAPLSAVRSQHLPTEVGLAGPMELVERAHASARFLVVDNDLTHCLGIGDLTVVRANGRWLRPLSLEVKSSGDCRIGSQVDLDIITTISDHPVDVALFGDFVSELGLKEPSGNSPAHRNALHQSREMHRRGEILLRLTDRLRTTLPRAVDSLWPAVDTLIARALTDSASVGPLDSGIIGFAVRNRPGDDPAQSLAHVLSDEGYTEAQLEPAVRGVSLDLRRHSGLSAIVPPIPLWRIPRSQRVALLTGEVVYGCIYDVEVWDCAMTEVGASLGRDGGRWVIRKGEAAAVLDEVEVQKLMYGVVFGGTRPREVAALIVADFARTPPDT